MSGESAGTRITRLDSGLVVVTDTMPHLRTASLGIWAGAGARFEDPAENGISHLLEHMAFKGTKRRTALMIAEEIENVGGDLNAATGLESTGYFARVLGEHVTLALDMLTDILTEPTFIGEELKREKGVILQEIGAANDMPEDYIYELFQRCAFPDQPIGRPILGTPETVKAQSSDSLRAYMARHYRAPQMVVSAAGAVDHGRVVEQIAKQLASLPVAAAPKAQPARYAGGAEIGARNLEQAHVVLGFEGRSFHAPDYYALQIFSNVLGGGSSSRLFQEVREKRGLCYSVYAYHSPYSDTGMFAIYAGTDPRDTAELMNVVAAELQETSEKATEIEVARAKAMMKVGLLMALESSTARADQLARQLLFFGRVVPVDEIVRRIDAVTVDDVRAAGRAVISSSRPTFAGVGPRTGIESAARIAENLARKAA
jgi:predicted Zn-dependent peptidase